MNPWSENNYPQVCIDAGVNCEECTSRTARELASCCKGLRGKMIGQLFVQLYPHPACQPMHGHFAECYREASEEAVMKMPPAFERREVRFARPRTAAAVA